MKLWQTDRPAFCKEDLLQANIRYTIYKSSAPNPSPRQQRPLLSTAPGINQGGQPGPPRLSQVEGGIGLPPSPSTGRTLPFPSPPPAYPSIRLPFLPLRRQCTSFSHTPLGAPTPILYLTLYLTINMTFCCCLNQYLIKLRNIQIRRTFIGQQHWSLGALSDKFMPCSRGVVFSTLYYKLIVLKWPNT